MSKEHRPRGEARGFNRLSHGLHGMISGLLSNFRLSLTFRIAIHYAFQLLRTTLGVMALMTVFFACALVPGMQATVKRIAASPLPAQTYSQEVIQDGSVTALWVDQQMPEGGERFRYQLETALTDQLFQNPPMLTIASARLEGKTLLVTFNLRQALYVWGILMLGLFVCDLCRIAGFLRRRNRLDKRVLAPIRDITAMAATLSASNLSNRINIAGTKNELKDLAVVINTMLDRIERSYNSQKQFVSDASHELRTPIAVIQGYVNMLSRWGKDDQAVLEEGITAIAQETASMKDLVESLLFLARHDKKTLMMEMEVFDPCDVVAELKKEAAMVTPEDHFILSPLEHAHIEADRGMIKQVMRILCDNAVKYTPSGGTITMGVESYPGGATLILSDNGPGISREELPKIFDRFYRADSARKAESGGHGLGLSIARIIVVAHGGKIRVRSKLGEGTTFAVVLPEKQTKRPAAPVQAAPGNQSAS